MSGRHSSAVVALVTIATLSGGPRLSGAGREGPTYTVAGAPAALRPAIQHGDLVIVALQTALLSELRRDLDSGGAAGAMQACHLDATAVAYRVAREEGIAAGRTSARLRNPTNAPRPWAAEIVARYDNQPTKGLDGFVVDLGDRIGLLRPIREQGMCAPCHGPATGLPPAVRAALADRYPADRAVGFADGDVRGWFWVEVKK